MDKNNLEHSIPTISDSTARHLEQSQSVCSNSNLSVGDVLIKITEFCNDLNSSYRLVLLHCQGHTERQNLLYSLITLKKSIKSSLEELGKSLKNNTYRFKCGLCDEEITVYPNENIWTSLQNHEHFEELYCDVLANKLNVVTLIEEHLSTVSESESISIMDDHGNTGDSNTDSGIEQHDAETSVVEPEGQLAPASTRSPSEDVNAFRFNFNISYDEQIEAKVYPSSLMSGLRKYDKVKEFTIMRAGSAKATCLVCNCELNGLKINKNMLTSHVMGQRHLKFSNDPKTLEYLQFFHDFWLRQEAPIQAHQVYFKRTENLKALKCGMCGVNTLPTEVMPHIFSNNHKKKVLEMYERRTNVYYLINLQVQAYGITKQEVEARREEELKLQEDARAKEVKRIRNSDSDVTDDQKKPAMKSELVDHKIIKAVEKVENANPIEQLPHRMKHYADLLSIIRREKQLVVRCRLCKYDLPYDAVLLKQHCLSIPSHIRRQKKVYKYYCEICNVSLKNELAWINHDFYGGRHESMASNRKAKVAEYECISCNMVIFGDEISLDRHRVSVSVKPRRERGARLPDPVKKLFQSKECIMVQAASMAREAEAVLKDSLSITCCQNLQAAISEIAEDCKVFPFGSRISGIGNKGSDLDVFVEVGGSYYGLNNQDPADQVIIIRKVYKVLSKYHDHYFGLVQVLTARTPILKLRHIPTSLDCDLSFKHGLSVENTKFLRLCIELQPVCQQLILLIKQWAEMIGYENITTYALAIMCIFYMQVNGYLLSVKRLRELNAAEHRVICGWQTINYVLSMDEMKSYVKVYEATVYELLQDFFKYYSKFDFNSYVLCPLLGELVKRSVFSEDKPDNLPPEMHTYVAQLEGEDPEIFRYNSFMCIQDPFDLSHNLTKAVQQGTLTTFQNMCKLSLDHIAALE